MIPAVPQETGNWTGKNCFESRRVRENSTRKGIDPRDVLAPQMLSGARRPRPPRKFRAATALAELDMDRSSLRIAHSGYTQALLIRRFDARPEPRTYSYRTQEPEEHHCLQPPHA